jgi:hypothetical protein
MSTIYTKVEDSGVYDSSNTYFYYSNDVLKEFSPASLGLYESSDGTTFTTASSDTTFSATKYYATDSSGTSKFSIISGITTFTEIKSITLFSGYSFYMGTTSALSQTAYINKNVFENGINNTNGLLRDSSGTYRNLYVVLFNKGTSDEISSISQSNIIAISGKYKSDDLLSIDKQTISDYHNAINMQAISYDNTYSFINTTSKENFTSLTRAKIATSGSGVSADGFAIIEVSGSTGSSNFNPISGDTKTISVPYLDGAKITTWVSALFTTGQMIYTGNNFSLTSTTINITVS